MPVPRVTFSAIRLNHPSLTCLEIAFHLSSAKFTGLHSNQSVSRRSPVDKRRWDITCPAKRDVTCHTAVPVWVHRAFGRHKGQRKAKQISSAEGAQQEKNFITRETWVNGVQCVCVWDVESVTQRRRQRENNAKAMCVSVFVCVKLSSWVLWLLLCKECRALLYRCCNKNKLKAGARQEMLSVQDIFFFRCRHAVTAEQCLYSVYCICMSQKGSNYGRHHYMERIRGVHSSVPVALWGSALC